MTLHGYVRVIRQRWIIVVSALLICLIAAGFAAQLRPKEYTSVITLYVTADATETDAAYESGLLAQQRASTYAELVDSLRVASDVADELRLAESPAELADRITVAHEEDSLIIDVTVTDRSASSSALVANTIGDLFPTLAKQLEGASGRPDGAPVVDAQVLERASEPTSPSSMGLPLTLALGLLGGLALGIVAAVVRNAFDSSLRDG